MIRNVIIGSCSFFSFHSKGALLTFFEAIIGCPGVFSEHLMPPRGVKPWLELLMQISCLHIESISCAFRFTSAVTTVHENHLPLNLPPDVP